MQTSSKFYYDASKDFEKPSRLRKILFSILIAITIISYGTEMLDPDIEISALRFVLYMTIILTGLVLLLFPPLNFRPFRRNRSSYVTLQDGLLQWKLGGEVQSVSINDVSQVHRSPSQVQFVMKDGSIRILDFYKIDNKQKVHEFLEVLQRQFYRKT